MQAPAEFISWPFRYVRSLTASSNTIKMPQYKKLVDNTQSLSVVIAGIPDGLSLLELTNNNKNKIARLNVFSMVSLTEKFLQAVDESYGDEDLPIVSFNTPCSTTIDKTTGVLEIPHLNFYTIMNKAIPPDGVSICVGEMVEYRYLQQRHLYPTLVWDPDTQNLFRFSMPPGQRLVRCIIMPNNFIRTSTTMGYWNFDGLIFYVFAKNCFLVGGQYTNIDLPYITAISTEDSRTLSIITNFFSKIGMHKIESTSINQIYAIDKYLTVIVGSLDNLSL